ncbi:hypothetical protein ACFE04_009074 [Oxalis oulophora]
MGCVSSKQTVTVTPALDYSSGSKGNSGRIRVGLKDYEFNTSGKSRSSSSKKKSSSDVDLGNDSGRTSSNCNGSDSVSFRLGNLNKYVEREQVAAGWPAWLSAVAGEAIQGSIPLKSDAFEKLEKIGQGTYSSVFRARDLQTGKIVALKKVRFDNFEPESVRFMAREILILRRLDHPNVIKLEGIITSRLSCSIYLVFEYMEHDLTGLLSSPDVKFTEPQIKCYMKQLLSGIEHCHSRGVMHRDIKGSNLLVNNEGILKVADFGLANFANSAHKQPLTSRVVTLWYRPPELLLGASDYGPTIDLWSVGCVFAELLLEKPIIQGRTEVEQLHKIFKLCGSPLDDYWKKSKLPHATLFKPQQHYDSCLRETFKDLPPSAVSLIETLLSVEPYKRGTASSALASEYFTTEPYECEPSSLPMYAPSKEIDAKHREEATRKKISSRAPIPDARKQLRKPHVKKILKCENVREREVKVSEEVQLPKSLTEKLDEALHVKNASQGDIPYSGPLQLSSSSGFAWAKRQKDDGLIRSNSRSILKGQIGNMLESGGELRERNNFDSQRRDNSRGHDSYEISSRSLQKQWSQFDRPDSFDASDEYHSQELSLALYQKEGTTFRRNNAVYQDGDKVEFSGPLLSQSHRIDELLEKHDRQIRQAIRKSWQERQKGLMMLQCSKWKREVGQDSGLLIFPMPLDL